MKMKRKGSKSKRKRYLLHFDRISKLRELKNVGPWKLMEDFLILALHCGK